MVIGACHYLEWPDLWGWQTFERTTWKELTWEEATVDWRLEANRAAGRVLSDDELFQKFNAAAGIRTIDDFLNSDDKAWLPFKEYDGRSVFKPHIAFAHTARGKYGNVTSTAIIQNVGMAWFILGVIYVGMFFLLADRKEKR